MIGYFVKHRTAGKPVKDQKGSTMKGFVLLAALFGAALALSACATVKGLGRDIQSVGQAGEDAINQ